MSAQDKNAKSDATQYELIDEPAKISKLLERMQNAHTLLSVRVPGSNLAYNSMILQIDAGREWITLDELHPGEGHTRLLEARKLTANGDFDGVELVFDATVIEHDKQSNIYFYRVSFPQRVKYFQRRSSYRVRVLKSSSLPVILVVDASNYLQGQLHNVSAGGVAIRFTRPLPGIIQRGQLIPECELRLPEGEKIVCSVEIRHVAREGQTSNTLVGARFSKLGTVQQRTLNRFIASIERELRRKSA